MTPTNANDIHSTRDPAHAPPQLHTSGREPLSVQVKDLTAQRLRVIAEPKRIALLEALNGGEAGVQELADCVGLPHQNASHHLTQLWNAGLLSRRREGNTTLYAVSDWSAWWVVEQIANWVQSCQEEQATQAAAA